MSDTRIANMNSLESVTRLIPTQARTVLLGTPVETAFRQIQKHTVPVVTVTGNSPVGPLSLCAPPDSILVELIRNNGVYEPDLTVGMLEVLDDDAVVYDVGSRYGYYSTLAVAAGVPQSNVHCFEADIIAHHILSENHHDESVVTNRVRVGEKTARGQTTLDAYAETHAPPTVVKIDTEGAEGDILRGASSVLRTHRPVLFVEMHPHRGVSVSKVIDRLRHHDYDLSVFIDHHVDEFANADGDAESADNDWNAIRRAWRPLDASDLPSDRTFLLRATPTEHA